MGKSIKTKLSYSRSRKKQKTQPVEENKSEKCWKKKSIFFELDYWKLHLVRHNLDVMHIEKNVCESIIGTLLNIPSKTKDGLAARKDLEEMNLRTNLAPIDQENRTYLPPACYTLSKVKKEQICKTLADIKVPEGYS